MTDITWRRIREALKKRTMSQARLARECGVTRASVNAWVNEDPAKRVQPTPDNLRCIADALAVSVAWLQGSPDAPGPADRPLPNVDPSSPRSRGQRAHLELLDKLGHKHPQLSANFNRTVRSLTGEPLRFDYISGKQVLDIMTVDVPPTKDLTPTLWFTMRNSYRRLWQLAVASLLDKDMSIDRCHCLLLLVEDEEALARITPLAERSREMVRVKSEAKLMSVDVVGPIIPSQAVDYIEEKEM